MAKTKISEFSSNPSNNTDINGINIAEGCAPGGINNAIRQLMADLKDFQTGSDGDSLTVGGALSVTSNASIGGNVSVTGTTTLGGNPTSNLHAATKQYVDTSFPSGGIIIWSGSAAAIPSGWYLCDGTNSTPDLRDRFVVGAGTSYSVGSTGGSKDAVVVSHTHTASVSDPGHRHTWGYGFEGDDSGSGGSYREFTYRPGSDTTAIQISTTGISVSNSTEGVSGTNANLPPYYALCYIMKA